MKSITEFPQSTLLKVLAAKSALTTEGKTPEEITTAMGESLKMEGDKLKFAMAAADLAAGKTAVRRVLVASIADGETPPAKYQKVEDNYYLVETLEPMKPKEVAAPSKFGRGGPRKGGQQGGGAKSSPWGASPEEIAAKKKASAAAAAAKK
ncbi:MAG: hypothetical protein A2622_07125 [Bdellovibrionales bacterium RIFCSPHIGHO2_01_FULL_40_29]|nr:MAG: hypothetical protein A2622_07125 [Bdellovibrionales bacterium RIFCSPHIGHO2_01_FULL_40_29]OFZ33246.1 MAG: hypothetical protein A3D17_12145 [Bdellovibrionales bacterium RIFCSPHIGHO2_02_FULL_40_15]